MDGHYTERKTSLRETVWQLVSTVRYWSEWISARRSSFSDRGLQKWAQRLLEAK